MRNQTLKYNINMNFKEIGFDSVGWIYIFLNAFLYSENQINFKYVLRMCQ